MSGVSRSPFHSRIRAISMLPRYVLSLFALPKLTSVQPGQYLAHFLGHEGPGSILSYLKRHGWVNSLRAGFQSGSVGFDFFKVTVDLTAEGLGTCSLCSGRTRADPSQFITRTSR